MIRFRRTRIKLRILYARLTRQPRTELRRHQFNFWAENGWVEGLDAVHLPLMEQALLRMSLSPRDRILDLACGGGLASRMVADTVGERSRVVGIDISDIMVRRARAKSKQFKNLDFMCCSADQIPLPDDYFSHILCVEAFYYFEDPEKVLHELLRVAAPLAELSLVLCLYKDYAPSLLTADSVDVPIQARSAAEYKQLLESTGWKDVQCEDYLREAEPGRKPDFHDRALFITARKPTSSPARILTPVDTSATSSPRE